MGARKRDERAVPDRIVLVDDDPIVLGAIEELLRSKGYEVYPARDGLEALQAIRKLKPTYVILDIVLPKIDGSRVCWLIRQDAHIRGTLIIAFSGLSPDQIRRFPELSADAYVAKGPLGIVANNILLAIKYLNERGRGGFEGGIFGYEGFRPRELISEMLFSRRFYATLVRTFDCGVLELDEEGRILMANAEACKILGKKENRLIAETLPSVIPPRDQRVVREIIENFKKEDQPETHRVVVSLSGREVFLRISPVIDDARLKGVVVTLEPKEPGAIRPQ